MHMGGQAKNLKGSRDYVLWLLHLLRTMVTPWIRKSQYWLMRTQCVCVSLPVFATLIVVDAQCYCMTVCCSQLGMCQCSRASCCLRISGTQKTSQSTVFRQMATQCGKRRRLRLTHGARKRRVRRDQQWSNCSAQHRRADDATPKETFEGQCQLSSHKQQCEPLRFHRFLFYASWSDVWAIENGVPQ